MIPDIPNKNVRLNNYQNNQLFDNTMNWCPLRVHFMHTQCAIETLGGGRKPMIFIVFFFFLRGSEGQKFAIDIYIYNNCTFSNNL